MRDRPAEAAALMWRRAAIQPIRSWADLTQSLAGLGLTLRNSPILPPVMTVAILLLTAGLLNFIHLGYGMHPGLAGFAQINSISARHLGMPERAINNRTGYDGQYYYFLALRPDMAVICAQQPQSCAMTPKQWPELRAQRIFYPLAARMVALGQPQAIPLALLLVNFLAILVTVGLVSTLSVEAGASPWLGAAAGMFSGEALGFLRDLADPFSIMWLVMAVWLFHKQRHLMAAGALAAALLTREPLLICVPLLFLPLVGQRAWMRLGQCLTIALGPFVVWQIILRALYGSWALITSDSTAAHLVWVPFLGLWEAQLHHGHDLLLLVLFVVLPLLGAVMVALWALRRRTWRGILADPLPLIVLVLTTMLSLTYWFQWADIWGTARLAAPGMVLAVIVTTRLRLPRIQASFGWLVALGAICTLFVAVR